MMKTIHRLLTVLAVLVATARAGPALDPGRVQVSLSGPRATLAPAVYFVAPDSPVVVLRIPRFTPVPDAEAVPFAKAYLWATRIRESGDCAWKVGSKGELGSYQFRYITWRQYSKRPFREAQSVAADAVARRHLAWIAQNLTRLGYPVDPFHLALAWNAGVDAVANGRLSASTLEYATAVAALTRDYMGRMAR
ncbi:MAG: hypothetical protein PHE83_17300 [Opitutaceae bacterium]|nr:hypothetical protein [Opitutaceae bacterium]